MIELTPFDFPCVGIDELAEIDAKSLFFDKCILLKEERTKKYLDYYNAERMNRYGVCGNGTIDYTHEYDTILPNWKIRLLIVGVEGDMVLVIIKHIQMFQHIYKRMEGLPISIEGNRKHEEQVFDALISSSLVEKILTIEGEYDWVETKGFTIQSELKEYNYFTDIPKHWNKISSGKWRSKKGINKLLKDPLLTYRVLVEEKDAYIVERMNNAFGKYKVEIEKEDNIGQRQINGYNKYPFWKNNQVSYCVFEYDGFPVGLKVDLRSDGVVYKLVNKSINRMLFDNQPIIPDKIKKRLGYYMHYIQIQGFFEDGLKVAYSDGVNSMMNKSTNVYKKETSDGVFSMRVYK